MSMLLGPLSETMSNVSCRDCALAGENTAGAAGSTLPAAKAVIDFRNSRRFIGNLPNGCPEEVTQRSCQESPARRDPSEPHDGDMKLARGRGPARFAAAPPICIQFASARLNAEHARPAEAARDRRFPGSIAHSEIGRGAPPLL